MKKTIFIFTFFLAAVASASGQHYRGFFDFTLSVPLSNSDETTFDVAAGMTLGGTTSHGVQFRNLFVGAGVGAMFIPSSYCVGLPVFAEARWDFFRLRTTNFFVGCKLGWIFNCGDESGISLVSSRSCDGYADYGSFYFQPSAGIRFRINNTMGINLALSYIPLRFNKENWFGPDDHEGWSEYSKFWSHRIALSIGLDF